MIERSTTDDPTMDGHTSTPVPPHEASAVPPRMVTSESLLAGGSQLAIVHNQAVYFLRKTRFGKLILTK